MVVHLSPKAKALTLPLNWSQFLKTLIGAENYTLFQLPPNKTGVRPSPSSFTRSRYTLLPLVSSPPSLDFCHSDISFSATSNRWKYRERATTGASRAWWNFYWETRREIGRAITGWSVDRLRNEVSVSERLAGIRPPTLAVVTLMTSRSRCAKSHRPRRLSQTEPRGYPFNKLVACRLKRATGDVP